MKNKALICFCMFYILKSMVVSQNVKISTNGKFCEPSIKINPKNTNNIVAGSVLNSYHYSNDGGKTWQTNTLKSPFGVYGDPVIDVDTFGYFYFTHLSNTPGGSWIDRIVCQKSEDQGKTWNDGSFVGLNGTRAQDKQWTVVNRQNNEIYMTWTEFDKYGSKATKDSSRILFAKSKDQGKNWSKPTKINIRSGDCLDGDKTTEGATPSVGPNGEIYVAWTGPNGIVFNKSLDGGRTWAEKEILIDSMPGGWDFKIPGLYRANGLPIIKCDLSKGNEHGTLYVNWADQRNGDTDIWLSKSKDGGRTWSKAVKVNDDNTNRHQFFTWMDIDQANGHLYFVFYDRRAYSNKNTDVYLAQSIDGGNTFKNIKISEKPFKPNTKIFFGDYNNISVHNNVIRPIWTRLDGKKLSIWTNITPMQNLFEIK